MFLSAASSALAWGPNGHRIVGAIGQDHLSRRAERAIRRIVGRVTDAVYVKPTLRLGPFGNSQHHVTIDLSLIDSTALYAATPPGQAHRLGDELDVELRYRLELGFEALLSYGVFFPGAGFRNLDLSLAPKPAQTFEAILAYRM